MTSYNEERGHNRYCGGCEYCVPSKEADLGAVLIRLVAASQPVFAQYKHTEEGRITEEMISEAWAALDEARKVLGQ